jgi:hypothetical protein
MKENKGNANNTGIIIEADKVIMNSGDFGYKITNVKALTRGKLPWMYLKLEPNIYKHPGNKISKYPHRLVLGNGKEIVVGSTYTKEEFKHRIVYCEKAGDRLMRIKKEINKLKKVWYGKERIVI